MSQTLDYEPIVVRRLNAGSPLRHRRRRTRTRRTGIRALQLARAIGPWGVLLGVLVIGTATVTPTVTNWFSLGRQISERRKVLAAVDMQNLALSQDIAYLKTKQGLEQQARKRGLVFEGEVPLALSTSSEETQLASRLARNDSDGAESEPGSIAERIRRAVDLSLAPLRTPGSRSVDR